MSNNAGKVLVCGAGGFIGSHLVKRLKLEGFWVRGADIKLPEFADSSADEFIQGDLRDPTVCLAAVKDVCEVYQLAADMGGAGYVFTGNNDATILRSSALINLNMIHAAAECGVRRIFYSSSACVYPTRNQEDPRQPNCAEESAYPADPDSEYGWEKLFSERVYLAYQRNTGIQVHIARFHNVFGPEGTWQGGREKSPAALCRKVAEASGTESIEIWGDGQQTRSFLYIDECIKGIRGLMTSNFTGPVNIGSEEMISIDNLAYMVMRVAGKHHPINHIDGPLGVRGRNSDNRLISTTLGWAPSQPLEQGIKTTYEWIARQVEISHGRNQTARGAIGHNRKFAAESVPRQSSKVFTSGNSLS